MLLSAALVMGCAKPAASEQQEEDEGKVVRIATYNVGVFNKYETSSVGLVASMMKELDLDALCLNELDSCTTRTGGVFQLGALCEAMGGWDYKWGQALNYQGGGYGIGIALNPRGGALEKWSVQLPKGDDSEVRALVGIETADFVVCTTHLGLTTQARTAQMNAICEEVSSRYPSCSKPVFLCGDFNCVPTSDEMTSFCKTWERISSTGATYSTQDPKKCIDYILRLRTSGSASVVLTKVCYSFESGSPKDASDHYPVYIEVKL